MKFNAIYISALILIILTLSGCTRTSNDKASTYIKITSEEAKEMIDNNGEIIILDVRTEEEYKEGHIKGAILIPNNQILENAEEELLDKEATILVYCRSGRRSAQAAADLASLGYTNVYDFGGIIDWKYEIVME